VSARSHTQQSLRVPQLDMRLFTSSSLIRYWGGPRLAMLRAAGRTATVAFLVAGLALVSGAGGARQIAPLPESAQAAARSPGWSLDAPLPQKRVDVVAVRATNGIMYAFGANSTVDAFNPATHRWSIRAPLPVSVGPAARATAAAGPNGTVYVVAGKTLEVYDPGRDCWRKRAPLPVARFDAAAVTGKDGKIYVIGGYRPDPASSDTYLYPRGLDVYDPGTNSWQVKAPLPTPRQALGAAVGPDGTLYAIGGGAYHYPSVTCTSVVEAYNPGTNRWRRWPPLPYSACGVSAGALKNGRIEVVGGATFQAEEEGSKMTAATGAILAFNPSARRWLAVSRSPYPRKRAGAAIDPNGSVYIIGGADRFGRATSTVLRFSPAR
jgi:N-acetylneuraminic acid mutarotase